MVVKLVKEGHWPFEARDEGMVELRCKRVGDGWIGNFRWRVIRYDWKCERVLVFIPLKISTRFCNVMLVDILEGDEPLTQHGNEFLKNWLRSLGVSKSSNNEPNMDYVELAEPFCRNGIKEVPFSESYSRGKKVWSGTQVETNV